MTTTEFKYIKIIEEDYSGKTRKFTMVSKEGGSVLGEIKWYGPWRKYCFYTTNDMAVFEQVCLLDICNFMDKLMEERKK